MTSSDKPTTKVPAAIALSALFGALNKKTVVAEIIVHAGSAVALFAGYVTLVDIIGEYSARHIAGAVFALYGIVYGVTMERWGPLLLCRCAVGRQYLNAGQPLHLPAIRALGLGGGHGPSVCCPCRSGLVAQPEFLTTPCFVFKAPHESAGLVFCIFCETLVSIMREEGFLEVAQQERGAQPGARDCLVPRARGMVVRPWYKHRL